MGYYTDFSLASYYRPLSEYLSTVNEVSGYQFEEQGTLASSKWYENDRNMCEVSRRFPEEIFILVGYGEDQNDIWRTAYHKGEAYPGKTVMYFEEIIVGDGIRIPIKEIR